MILGFMQLDINLLVNVILAVFVIPTSAGVFKLNREVGEIREQLKLFKELYFSHKEQKNG